MERTSCLSLLSQLTWSWLHSFVSKNKRRRLEPEHIWPLPAVDSSKVLLALWHARYPSERAAAAGTLFPRLAALFWRRWALAGACYLLWCVAAGLQPFTVKWLLDVLEGGQRGGADRAGGAAGAGGAVGGVVIGGNGTTVGSPLFPAAAASTSWLRDGMLGCLLLMGTNIIYTYSINCALLMVAASLASLWQVLLSEAPNPHTCCRPRGFGPSVASTCAFPTGAPVSPRCPQCVSRCWHPHSSIYLPTPPLLSYILACSFLPLLAPPFARSSPHRFSLAPPLAPTPTLVASL